MSSFVIKNGHQEVMCYDEIGHRVQNLNTILGSIMKHDWEGLRKDLKRKIISTLPFLTFPHQLQYKK